MLKELAEVYRYRDLLLTLVIRDLKVRYKNSVLGFIWSLLIPLTTCAVLTIVFKYIMGITTPNYSAYLLVCIIPYGFFQTGVLEATSSVSLSAGLVKKNYFPRELIPASVVLSNFIHLLLAMVVFFLYLGVLRLTSTDSQPPVMITWLLLPVVIFINLMLTLGVAFFTSCINLYYEDVKYLATVVLTLAFYLLPIIYMVEQPMSHPKVVGTIRILAWCHYYLNPVSFLMIAYRKVLLPPFNAPMSTGFVHDVPLNYWLLGLCALTSFIIFLSGYSFFNARKWHFAERL